MYRSGTASVALGTAGVGSTLAIRWRRGVRVMSDMRCAYCDKRFPWGPNEHWPFYPLYAECADHVKPRRKRWWRKEAEGE